MPRYEFPKTDFDAALLATQISTVVGRTVAVRVRFPEISPTGKPVGIGELEVVDPETDEEVTGLSASAVASVVQAHTLPSPPETPEVRRARLHAKADAATSIVALRAVVKELIDRVG